MKDNAKTIYLLEVLNSICWFLMDSSWMLEYQSLAYFFALPTIVTGLLTLLVSQKPVEKGINFTVLTWIVMNVSWLLSEANPWIKEYHICLALFFVSFASMLLTFVLSDYSLESFRMLRRFRFKNRGPLHSEMVNVYESK